MQIYDHMRSQCVIQLNFESPKRKKHWTFVVVVAVAAGVVVVVVVALVCVCFHEMVTTT